MSWESTTIEQKGQNGGSTILIAEDNVEVMDYLYFCLKENYQVIKAYNGSAALQVCQKNPPDLIISDVIMPKLDGYQLIKEIRSNQSTDHIPIILLTAKSTRNDRLNGLSLGADAYLTKPFDRKELQVRIDQLISVREKLRIKFQQGDFSGSNQNPAINVFIKKIVQFVHENLDNDELSIEQLADHMNFSRVHLYRKIKALSDMSPSQFIRKIRLQKASEMIQQGEYSISEVAYQTGFKDPSYFTRIYTKEFGQTPSAARNY